MKTVPVDNRGRKSLRAGRAALVLGAAGGTLLVAGCSGASVAQDSATPATAAGASTTAGASTGTAARAGGVTLSAASGSTSSTPTWSTTGPCPAGFTGSAVFYAIFPAGGDERISPVVASVASAFHGTLFENIGLIQSDSRVANGGTQELAVQCWSGASTTGHSEFVQGLFITYSADGKTYKISASRP